MSVIYKGALVDNIISTNAKGGTEFIRDTFMSLFKDSLYLNELAIHFSRPNHIYEDVKNIFYAHDLPEDGANNFLYQNLNRFDGFVFVSHHQMNRYLKYNPEIPLSKCYVVYNTTGVNKISVFKDIQRKLKEDTKEKVKFIYHTTPHRGLEILYHVFDELSKYYHNIQLDVYSSFDIYGWPERDEQYKFLFEKIQNHPKMTYNKNIPREKLSKILPNYDVFLYPCVWEETYCIALSEAISSGLVCIHNDHGSLPETSFHNSFMFNSGENVQSLFENAVKKTHNILSDFKNNKEVLLNNNIENLKRYCPYTLDNFEKSWNYVIRKVLHK